MEFSMIFEARIADATREIANQAHAERAVPQLTGLEAAAVGV